MLLVLFSDANYVLSGFNATYTINRCSSSSSSSSSCSSHGECINNQCVCNPGWVGIACDTPACPNNCSFVNVFLSTSLHRLFSTFLFLILRCVFDVDYFYDVLLLLLSVVVVNAISTLIVVFVTNNSTATTALLLLWTQLGSTCP